MLVRSFALLAAMTALCVGPGTGTAYAVTLRTLFVFVDSDQAIRVLVTNRGTKPLTDLTVTLTDTNGNVDAPSVDFCAEGGPLAPGSTCQVIYTSNHRGFATVTAKGKISASAQVIAPGPALVAVFPATK
jgi:hypothetical protein